MALRSIVFISSLIFLCCACNRESLWLDVIPAPFMQVEDAQIDSLIQQMSLAEKVGQLIFLKFDATAACSEDSLYNIAHSGKIGGLMLQKQTLSAYARIVKNCQELAPHPLLIGTEEMVSLSNQFRDAPQYPNAASISSISNDSLHQELIQLYSQQCAALGIHFSMASNINKNTAEKAFDFSSYGNDEANLIQRSSEILSALQASHILAVGTSFNEIIQIEEDTLGIIDRALNCHKQLSKQGLSAWKINDAIYGRDAVQHYFPAYLKDYLYQKMGFGGLILSEVTELASVEKLLHAGNDIFIVAENHAAVFQSLYTYASTGLISKNSLNAKVKKILKAKSWAFEKSPPTKKIDLDLAETLLLDDQYEYLVKQLYQASIILAHNRDLVPFKQLNQEEFQLFYNKNANYRSLNKYLNKYAPIEVYPIDWNIPDVPKKEIAARLLIAKETIHPSLRKLTEVGGTKIVVIDHELHPVQDEKMIQVLNEVASHSKLLLLNFGNPFNLRYFNQEASSIQVFEKNKTTEKYVAELVFGGRSALGKLPLHIATHLPYGQAHPTAITRLNFADAEEHHIAPEKLVGIDAIVNTAISKKAIPGAQVLIIRKGSVIYNKTFGFHTYNKAHAVKHTDLYDLASLTKITATTLAAMKLYDEGMLDINERLNRYFDTSKNSRLGRISINSLLLHNSRLQANMPVYDFIKNKNLQGNACNENFCSRPQLNFTSEISKNVYARDNLVDEMLKRVLKIKPYSSYKYRYSDVNFNLLQQIIEQKTGEGLDSYLDKNFYSSLNMQRCLYRPLSRYKVHNIAPTALDTRWRMQILQGYVHDESAALMGGVAGNAGLFSNAENLAILYQMLLNGGEYGSHRYLSESTIEMFTKKQRGSRRGLGFDKPRRTKVPSYSSKASSASYGHTGFTGTSVWVDPEEELIFIFLSNRVYPDPSNKKLFRYKTRKRIHDIVYKAFDTFEFEWPTSE